MMLHKKDKLDYIALNIRHLVELEGMGRDAFGELFGLNRGSVGCYINGKSKPKIETLRKICQRYNLTLDNLVNSNLRYEEVKAGTSQDREKELLSRYSVDEIVCCILHNEAKFKDNVLFKSYIKSVCADQIIQVAIEKYTELKQNREGDDQELEKYS